VHEGKLDKRGNRKSTQASCSVACDGKRVFVVFVNGDAVHATALDLDGKILWTTKVSEWRTHQGFGSSPTLHKHLVFVTTDSPAGGTVAALDRGTGTIVWRDDRAKKANYASAQVLPVAGKDQLLMQGCDLVTGYDPLTGSKFWEVAGSTTECVTHVVTDGTRVFVSGGYPKKHVQAIVGDGSGRTAWENPSQVYVPSMICRGGHLYAVTDPGVAMCWRSDTGEEVWKQRLGGTFTSSLVLAGDVLHATNEAGTTFLFRADPAGYEALGENQVGQEAYATPTICGSRIYHRVVDQVDGKRQEMLYCFGTK
jgi:outer membrane protein assembly factor BamB